MARPAIEGPSDRVKNKSKITPPPRDQLRSLPPTFRRHYPRRVSALPAFWLLDSFNETKNWTDNQKDSAIKAVKKLMRDYEIILKEHQEMREHVEENPSDKQEDTSFQQTPIIRKRKTPKKILTIDPHSGPVKNTKPSSMQAYVRSVANLDMWHQKINAKNRSGRRCPYTCVGRKRGYNKVRIIA
jgi:ribosomal protein S15P/S13E